jgi:hypothetical protein
VVLSIAVLSGILPNPASGQIVSPRLKKNKTVIRRVVLFPSQLHLVMVTRNGTAGLSEKVAALLDATLAKELIASGVEVLPNPLEQAKDDASRYAVADMQAKYDTLRAQLAQKPKDLIRGRYTLGDSVASFGPGASAEAFVFVRAKGGYKLTTPLFGSPFDGDLALVDAKTGEVLAWSRFWSGESVLALKNEMLTLDLRAALHKMPFPKHPKMP